MLPIKIKKHKQGNHTIEEQELLIPCEWNQLTLGQFLSIIEEKNIDAVSLLSILSGLSKDMCMQIPAYAMDTLVKNIYFLNEPAPDFSKWKLPTEVLIDGRYHRVPNDLKKETWGQKIMAQQEVNAMIEGKMKTYEPLPYLLAVYFYPIVTEDKAYTDEKVRAFVPTIMRMNVVDALPIGNFFLSSCLRSLKLSQRLSVVNQLSKRRELELKDLKSSG